MRMYGVAGDAEAGRCDGPVTLERYLNKMVSYY
jgi:hypothetical protein